MTEPETTTAATDVAIETDPPAPAGRNWFWPGLGITAAVALALRLWVVFVQRPTVSIASPGENAYALGGDAFYYHWQARGLADGHWFVDAATWQRLGEIQPSAAHPPLYSSYLGAVSWLGAQGVTAHRVASCFLGVATVVVLGLVARRIAGNAAGLIAAAIAALYPQLWINDGMLLSESMSLLMVSLALLVAYQYWEQPRVLSAAILGGVIGLAGLSRSELLLLFPCVVLPLTLGSRGLDGRKRLRLLGVGAATCAVVLAPWFVYTSTAFEHPVTMTTGSGITLAYGSCDEVFEGEFIGYYANCLRDFPPLGTDESVRDRAAREDALDYLSEHTSRLPIVVAARIGRMWGVFKPSQTTFLDWWLEGRGHAASVIGAFSFYALMPFAIGGVIVLRRRRLPISPLVAMAGIATLAGALTFGVTRYRSTAEPAIVVAAAVGIVALARSLLDRRAGRAAPATDPEPAPEPATP